MRDIVLLMMLIGVIPFILRKPWIGIIAWVVVSVMNPHRLAYGFMYDLPVAQIIAIVTLLAILFSKGEKRLPLNAVTVILILFVVWMNVTTVFALYPDAVFPQWEKVMKIMLMVFVAMILLHTRQHIDALVWAIVISLGFYGVKGGVFALLTAGNYRIYGPAASDVGDNNAISFALVMILPLMYYLSSVASRKLVKRGLQAAILFCALSILATHSRGAFLALVCMAAFLVLKSDKKMLAGIAVVIAAIPLLTFMPESWVSRMESIKDYKQDASAMGRINTWWMGFNLANDRPLVGGGFQIYNPESFLRWAPNPEDIHAAHSIYFAALGEHGYVGLFLFLGLCWMSWKTGTSIIKKTSGIAELGWASMLARMLQVSMIGYWVGGAFLSVLYFDVFYYIVTLLVLLRTLIEREIKSIVPAGKYDHQVSRLTA